MRIDVTRTDRSFVEGIGVAVCRNMVTTWSGVRSGFASSLTLRCRLPAASKSSCLATSCNTANMLAEWSKVVRPRQI